MLRKYNFKTKAVYDKIQIMHEKELEFEAKPERLRSTYPVPLEYSTNCMGFCLKCWVLLVETLLGAPLIKGWDLFSFPAVSARKLLKGTTCTWTPQGSSRILKSRLKYSNEHETFKFGVVTAVC